MRRKAIPYTIEQLERHAASLSADHHEVLANAVDLPMDRVAEKLNIPIGTVKSRLNRAREKLAVLEEKRGQET